MSIALRYILGTLATTATLYDITTINTMHHFSDGQPKHKKILTFTNLHFMQPNEGDLVLTRNGAKLQFKVVETGSGKYTQFNRYGMSMLVPQGFVELRNVETGEKSLECYGAIVGQFNFDVTWLDRIINGE